MRRASRRSACSLLGTHAQRDIECTYYCPWNVSRDFTKSHPLDKPQVRGVKTDLTTGFDLRLQKWGQCAQYVEKGALNPDLLLYGPGMVRERWRWTGLSLLTLSG